MENTIVPGNRQTKTIVRRPAAGPNHRSARRPMRIVATAPNTSETINPDHTYPRLRAWPRAQMRIGYSGKKPTVE
jgi:hypothetical protein